MTGENKFNDWLKVSNVELPIKELDRKIALENLRRAFYAGFGAGRDSTEQFYNSDIYRFSVLASME